MLMRMAWEGMRWVRKRCRGLSRIALRRIVVSRRAGEVVGYCVSNSTKRLSFQSTTRHSSHTLIDLSYCHPTSSHHLSTPLSYPPFDYAPSSATLAT